MGYTLSCELGIPGQCFPRFSVQKVTMAGDIMSTMLMGGAVSSARTVLSCIMCYCSGVVFAVRDICFTPKLLRTVFVEFYPYYKIAVRLASQK